MSFSWNGFFNAFRLTVGELKAHMKWKYIHCRNIFARLRVAYQGLIWRDLSIDLVAAALRQRGFADKITGEDCNGIDSPMALVHAITRYHKFMLLLKRDKLSGKIRNSCRHWMLICAGIHINCALLNIGTGVCGNLDA